MDGMAGKRVYDAVGQTQQYLHGKDVAADGLNGRVGAEIETGDAEQHES
jgi:hypothetical protein